MDRYYCTECQETHTTGSARAEILYAQHYNKYNINFKEARMSKIGVVSVKTIRWQCSGCDHLCAMLTDEVVSPKTLVICPNSNWRIETTAQNEDR